jgi:hypothetical protein
VLRRERSDGADGHRGGCKHWILAEIPYQKYMLRTDDRVPKVAGAESRRDKALVGRRYGPDAKRRW